MGFLCRKSANQAFLLKELILIFCFEELSWFLQVDIILAYNRIMNDNVKLIIPNFWGKNNKVQQQKINKKDNTQTQLGNKVRPRNKVSFDI